jgi:hypothetical protein
MRAETGKFVDVRPGAEYRPSDRRHRIERRNKKGALGTDRQLLERGRRRKQYSQWQLAHSVPDEPVKDDDQGYAKRHAWRKRLQKFGCIIRHEGNKGASFVAKKDV